MSQLLFGTPGAGPAPPPPPAGSLTPDIWLMADHIGGQSMGYDKITFWSEEGTLNSFTQFVRASQPAITPAGLNGLPTVQFSAGQNLSANETRVNYTDSWTIIAVVKTTGQFQLGNVGAPGTIFFDISGSTLGAKVKHSLTELVSVSFDASPIDTWKIVSITYLGTGVASGFTGYINGVLKTTTIVSNTLAALSSATDSAWYIGSPGSLTGGNVAEVLLFLPHLTDEDRATMEAYLNTKWFVATSPTPTGTGTRGTGHDVINLNAFPIQAPFDQNQ